MRLALESILTVDFIGSYNMRQAQQVARMSLLALLLNVIGLMALVAMCLGSIERLYLPALLKGIVQGIPFGVATCVTMLMPAILADGTVVNGKSLMLAFAAAFGGVIPFLLASVMATVGHVELTDIGLSQTIRPTITAGVLGLGWRFLIYPRFGLSFVSLILLGVTVSGLALLLLLVPSGQGVALLLHTYPATLAGSIAAAMILGRLIERELRHFSEMQLWQRQAYTDPLTGLANKRAFYEATAALALQPTSYSILVTDVDHFKKVNDTYGHEAGDELLKAIASSIQSSLPLKARAFRLGGEEFVVLLVGMESDAAFNVAEIVRCAVDSVTVYTAEHRIRATVSIGLADSRGDTRPPRVVAAADTALYTAKANGRNRTVVSSYTDTGDKVIPINAECGLRT
jgi:diguanylate cyclase